MQAVHKSFQQAVEEHLRLRGAFKKCLSDFQHTFAGHWQDTSVLTAKLGETLTTNEDSNFGAESYNVPTDANAHPTIDQLPTDHLTIDGSGNGKQTHADLADDATSLPPMNVRMIAHDLRAPLASAALSLQIARDSRTPPEKLEKALDLAEKSLEVLGALIDSLVGMTKDERPGDRLDVREHLPYDLIANAIDQVSPLAAKRNLRLSASKPTKLPVLHCDGMQVTRVLVNLLSNAIKYTPEGGQISVDACKRNNDGHPAIVFSVIDNGPGVSGELVEKIFDVGVSIAKDGKPSTGLGLAVCREIVEAHQGRVWVETDRSDGATFSFAIPLDLVPRSDDAA